jgi:hypothetical protein
MYPAITCLAILLGGVLPSSATAKEETTISTLEEVGFFGTWAIRCDEPASLDNVVRSAYVSAAGDPGFSEDLGADLPQNTYRILAAQRDGDNQIILDIEFNVETKQRLTMVVDGNRIRTLTNALPDGRELVHSGSVVATGNRTPWLNRCETTEGRQ